MTIHVDPQGMPLLTSAINGIRGGPITLSQILGEFSDYLRNEALARMDDGRDGDVDQKESLDINVVIGGPKAFELSYSTSGLLN
jgi:hypothetical protein